LLQPLQHILQVHLPVPAPALLLLCVGILFLLLELLVHLQGV
jgi:membrane-bound ClpP family serine protease